MSTGQALAIGSEKEVELVVQLSQLVASLLLALLVRVADLRDSVLKRAETFLLDLDLSLHLAERRFHIRELHLHLRLSGLVLMLHVGLQLTDLAFPDVLGISNSLLVDKKNVLVVLELLLNVKHPDEVSDHGNLLLCGSLYLHLLDSVECIAHDSDQ